MIILVCMLYWFFTTLMSVILLNFVWHLSSGLSFGDFKDVAETISWIVAWFVAIYWLKAWKKQMKWTVEYDIARKIMHSAYRIRDGVQIIRNPIMWVQEQEYTWERDGLDEDQIKLKGKMNAYNKRFMTLTEVREKLLVDIIEAEVLWWVQIRHLVYDLLLCLRKLEMAVEDDFKFANYTDYQRRQDSYYQTRVGVVHDILYSHQMGIMMVEPHEEDKYANELKSKIDAIDVYMREYIDFD